MLTKSVSTHGSAKVNSKDALSVSGDNEVP